MRDGVFHSALHCLQCNQPALFAVTTETLDGNANPVTLAELELELELTLLELDELEELMLELLLLPTTTPLTPLDEPPPQAVNNIAITNQMPCRAIA